MDSGKLSYKDGRWHKPSMAELGIPHSVRVAIQYYVRLVEGARRVLEQAERMRMCQQADKILVEEAPILPLCYGRFHMLMKPWVKKLVSSPLKWWSWKDVILEPH